ncbi:MAG: ABC transporter permease [Oscillospiraceae bacterium]|nr:ABC transporter permease [Oscillospiraceae bacterium]
MDKTNRSGSDLKQKKFLLKQLIHRDFKSRYKRTFLGVLWSMLSPLCFFVTQAIVFSKLLGRGEYFLSYLIIGNIVFHYFSDATTNLMFSISANGGIISKINVDKRLFIYSRSISCLINFLLTMVIMFGVIAINGITFNVKFILLIFPIVCLYFLNMGVGYILSVLFVFFKDTQYIYSIFTRMLTYFSAIFYYVDSFPENIRHLFFYNPVYCYIYYFRTIIIDNMIPSMYVHFMCVAFPIAFLLIGKAIYGLNEKKFAYYF